MATTQSSGGHSPKSFSGTVEKAFDEARHTGVINLTNRKLKDFPKYGKKHDLRDTTTVDISKNRFSDVPAEVCSLPNLEDLNCYSNILKCIPEAIVQLQSLVRCNLSRNQLTYIPQFICQLQNLEVLLACNNRLVSLPEEIGHLTKLMDLDISCNEITHLPPQMGELESLRSLNVRRNLLVELPTELCQLRLRRLDMSDNRISQLPHEYRHLDSLDTFSLQNNPLVSPPAQVCQKGRVHIMKYLEKEARKEDRKRGVLSEFDIKSSNRLSGLPQSLSDEFTALSPLSEKVIKRRTVDSGYSTTDSMEKHRFSPSEYCLPLTEAYPTDPGYEMYSGSPPVVSASVTLTQAFRRMDSNESHMDVQQQLNAEVTGSNPRDHHKNYSRDSHQESLVPISNPRLDGHQTAAAPSTHNPSVIGPPRPLTTSPQSRPNLVLSIGAAAKLAAEKSQPSANDKPVDEFTLELQKQKSEYEAKKRRAEQMKIELESREQEPANGMTSPDREREETRRAALKLQEEQKALMDRNRKVSHSGSFKEEKNGSQANPYTNRYFRRTVSEASYAYNNQSPQQQQQPPASSERSLGEGRTNVRSPPYQLPPVTGSNLQNQPPTPTTPVTPTNPDGEQYGRLNAWSNSEPPGSPLTPKTPTPDGKKYTAVPRDDNGTQIPVQHYQSSQISPQQQHQQQPQSPGDGRYDNHTSPAEVPIIAAGHNQPLEFRRRHEALIQQQRQEAQLTRRRLEEEKQRLKLRQKDAVRNYVSQRQPGHNESSSDSSTFSFSRDSTPNTSFDASSMSGDRQSDLPKYQKALDKLEAMSSELNNMNPGFTVRRQLKQYSREGDQVEQLRGIIESCLKVKLPDDLPSALRDGVVLCHLANHIKPRAISSIHVPSQAAPKLSMAKCRRNVENFLEACRQIGVKDEYVCTANSVLEEHGLPYLNITVQCLLNCAAKSKPQHSTV